MFRAPKKSRNDEDDEMTDLAVHLVVPGEIITSDTAFMRGHGTYNEEESLVASVLGVVDRVNKLISVKPLRARFNGEIGDVVVGRVIEVGPKRWKVDIAAKQDAVLPLAARRRSESDELQMRSLLNEAEIQAFFGDGAVSLHTRSLKYGKLRTGRWSRYHQVFVKRSKSHFLSLPYGIDIVLGLNGYIWISKHAEKALLSCISALALQGSYISDTSIHYVYEASLAHHPKDILAHAEDIIGEARSRMVAENIGAGGDAVAMDWNH
ncbi:hypothetical protein BC829DRAFT_389079 [Chytridium lagenaria]|nr:hypothetical protein BC829DRAFT_389079 [Chytridium lagenaria]